MVTRTYSEVVAAEKLGVNRTTLRLWRNSGRVPESAFAKTASVRPGGRGRTDPIAYRADVIDKVAAGGEWPAK